MPVVSGKSSTRCCFIENHLTYFVDHSPMENGVKGIPLIPPKLDQVHSKSVQPETVKVMPDFDMKYVLTVKDIEEP